MSHAEARRRGVVRCFQFSILPNHNNCIGAARNRPYTSYFRLHASYFDLRFRLRLKPTHSEMDCVSRGGTETRSCAVFSILPNHNNCIGAARNRSYTSYFRLHASYFDLRFRLRLKPTHSEMDYVSRGGTETQSCAVFSILPIPAPKP